MFRTGSHHKDSADLDAPEPSAVTRNSKAAKFSGDADMQKQLRDQCLKWPGFSMSLVSNCLFVALLAWDFRGQK